jgi:hypothetical protein
VKPLCFARVSKFNVLMFACILGSIAFSLPAVADPTEICVMTSTGAVACGKTVPKPSSNLNQIENSPAPKTAVDGSVNDGVISWRVVSCEQAKKKQENFRCVVHVGFGEEEDLATLKAGLKLETTKIVDGENNQYISSSIEVLQISYSNLVGKAMTRPIKINATDLNDGKIEFIMGSSIRYRLIINFPKVPSLLSQVKLLQLDTSRTNTYGNLLLFRNVPIREFVERERRR